MFDFYRHEVWILKGSWEILGYFSGWSGFCLTFFLELLIYMILIVMHSFSWSANASHIGVSPGKLVVFPRRAIQRLARSLQRLSYAEFSKV